MVGVGFQLQDDLLGIFGHSAKSGKSTENDLKEGKKTSLITSFYSLASKEQIAQFNQVFNNSQASGKQISSVKALIESVGAKKAIQDKVARKYDQATSLIDRLNIDDKNKSAYLRLVDKSLNRDH